MASEAQKCEPFEATMKGVKMCKMFGSFVYCNAPTCTGCIFHSKADQAQAPVSADA